MNLLSTTYNLQPERGVTLLMSILILAGITLISVTVGFFTIQEIRASRAIVLSEPAISAAESAGEQGIWALKRSGTIANCPQFTTNTLGRSVVDFCKSYGPAVITLESNTPKSIFLYNPDDINGDIDLSEFPYSFVQVTHLSGAFTVNVTVERLGAAGPFASANVAPSSTQVINTPSVPADTEGRMKVILSSTGDG
ncbi:MAG: hypothetical protein Q8P83_00075, partial [bacterium]|nr:hypothetical protein [bacterium]